MKEITISAEQYSLSKPEHSDYNFDSNFEYSLNRDPEYRDVFVIKFNVPDDLFWPAYRLATVRSNGILTQRMEFSRHAEGSGKFQTIVQLREKDLTEPIKFSYIDIEHRADDLKAQIKQLNEELIQIKQSAK